MLLWLNIPYILFAGMLLSIPSIKASLTPVVSYEYNILDLTSSNANIFASQSQYWSFNGDFNPSVPKFFTFSSTMTVGMLVGFTGNDCLERTYTDLGAHNIIYYSIRIFIVDGWQSGDKLKLELDGTVIADWEPFTVPSQEYKAYWTDGTLDDLSIFFVGKLAHSGSTLNLKATSNIVSGSTTATFGIRGIRMSFGHRKANDVDGMCVRLTKATSVSNCPCRSGYAEFPPSSGTCVKCADSSEQCFGPGDDQAYGCASGYAYNGNTCVKCAPGCTSCLGSNPNICLLCSTSQMLSWDRTCVTSCNAPNYLRTEGGFQFCEACQPGYFRYPNGTCLPECKFPRKERVEVSSRFCDAPCQDPSHFYYPKESLCKPGCAYPNEVRDNVFCVLGLPEAEVKQTQAIAGGLSIGSKVTGAVSSIAGALSSGDPGAFCLATLSEMLHYMRYMKISYPPRVQYILDQENVPLLDLIPEMPQEIIDRIPSNALPEKFEKYELPSSFLVNFWEPAITLTLLLIGGVFLSPILEKCLKQSFLHTIFKKIKETVKWNFLLMYLISYIEDIVMPSSFEFRTVSFDSYLSILSFGACVLVNAIFAFVIFKMVSVLWKLWKTQSLAIKTEQPSLVTPVKEKLRDYQVLFEESKEDSLLSLSFMFFFVLKVYLFYCIIAYLFDYPRVQTILLTTLSLLMVIYLIFGRPLKSKINLLQNIIQETIVLLVNVCALILSFIDLFEIEDLETRRIIGEVLIGCDMAFSAFGVFCLICSLGATLYGFYKAIKARLRIKKFNTQKKKILKAVVPYSVRLPAKDTYNISVQDSSVSTNDTKLSKGKGSGTETDDSRLHSNQDNSFLDPKLSRGCLTDDSVNLGLMFPMSRPLSNKTLQPVEINISMARSPNSTHLTANYRPESEEYDVSLNSTIKLSYGKIARRKKRDGEVGSF